MESKEIEKEVIEVNLESSLNYLLIKDLEKSLKYAPSILSGNILERVGLLESVLSKSKNKKPRFFSARQCAILLGYCDGNLSLSKDKRFLEISNAFKTELDKWEEANKINW